MLTFVLKLIHIYQQKNELSMPKEKNGKQPVINKKLLNQSELSRLLGVHQTYISKVINGERTGPKAQKLLERISAVVQNQLQAA